VKKLLVLFLVFGLASVSFAEPTAEDVETTVETALGLGSVTTYLELTNNSGGTGDSRNGFTLVTPTDQWGYPDGSDSGAFVNYNSLDEDNWNHGGDAGDFLATISNLAANTDYGLCVLAAGRIGGGGAGMADFSWGTVADGSAVNTVSSVSTVLDGIAIPTGESNAQLFAITVGIFTSDEDGDLSIWLGKGEALDGENYRTQFDGLLVGEGIVPEPATIMLLGLGGLALIRKKR